jgi:3-oxoacyl-[acyl-carrier-protein] synthase-1
MSAGPPPQGNVVIAGVGARSSIGLNALQTTMGIRAEVLRPMETRFVDTNGDPVGMCCVSCIDPILTGVGRLKALAIPAMREAAADFLRAERARRGAASPLPLVIAIPEGVVEYSLAKQASHLLTALLEDIPELIDPNNYHEIAGGRAAGVTALGKAMELLGAGAEAVLVGGVDSYYDPDRLERLADEYRLHGLTTENGFIPGEASAFVLLTHRGRSSALTRYASVLGHAVELEPRPFGSDEPCQALGMTAALRKATSSVGASRRIGWQLTDVVDERHRVDEWQYARTRTFRLFTDEVVHEQPLLLVGDVGAAATSLLMVDASVRWQTGCGLADLALIAVHSDGAERGVALLAGEAT